MPIDTSQLDPSAYLYRIGHHGPLDARHATLEAIVAGLPDDFLGEKIKAYVVLNHGETATPEERELARRRRRGEKAQRVDSTTRVLFSLTLYIRRDTR